MRLASFWSGYTRPFGLSTGYLRIHRFSLRYARHNKLRVGQPHCFTDRQTNREDSPATFTILRNNLPAVRLDQPPRNRQAEPETAGASAWATIEFLEYFFFLTWCKTGAAIGDGNHEHGIIAGDIYFNRTIALSIGRRIREQCVQGLLNQTGIHRNRWQILSDIDFHIAFFQSGGRHRFAHELAWIAPLSDRLKKAGFQTRCVE